MSIGTPNQVHPIATRAIQVPDQLPASFPVKRMRKFSLATGCELLEQYHARQQILRDMTGKQTAHDKAREAVAAIKAQFDRRAA